VGLYVKHIDGRIVQVTVYVDDMVIVGKTSDINAVVEALQRKFTMKDLGRVRYLLSMEIHYEHVLMLCPLHTVYIKRLLTQFQMEMARSVGSFTHTVFLPRLFSVLFWLRIRRTRQHNFKTRANIGVNLRNSCNRVK
jgi:hypothetical protein